MDRQGAAAAGLTVYNPISLGGWRPVLRRQPGDAADVALTFDDGPDPHSTPHVLALLKQAGATATFFLSGVRVAAYPDLAAAIVAAGHAVYGHGWEHVDLVQRGPGHALAAMERVEALLARLRPTPSPYLIRLPYHAGYNRSWMHREMQRFHADARFAWWSHSTHDWTIAEGCGTETELGTRCAAVAGRLAAAPGFPGSIVLLHENAFDAPGPHAPSVARLLLAPILDRIAQLGLSAQPIRVDNQARSPLERFVYINRPRALRV